MLAQDSFRSLVPLYNSVGFGATGFLLLAPAFLLVAVALLHWRIDPVARRFAERTQFCILALSILPVALRLALLPRSPAPTPNGADDFAYLLLADTLRHFRLTNPMHPMRHFFEAVFLLQEPSYSSIFPLGQGIALAVGWIIFGHLWAGVLLSCGAFCGLCYWMLRGWVSPGWALAGGLIAVMEFGPLCQWMNLYWGGAVSAIAGCLVFGAIPRLGAESRAPAFLLGCGLAIQMLTRPFEAILLAVCIFPFLWRERRRAAWIALALVPAAGLMAVHNRAVTGRFTVLPYQLSQYQYGIPASFTFQQNPTPHRDLTAEQELDYRAQSIIHGDGPETVRSYIGRWRDRIGFYRFFFYAPLCVALPAFLLALRERRYQWVALTVVVFSLGTNFYPYFYPHYVAALTCLFVLVSVVALQQLARWKPAAAILLSLCGAEFLFWYSLRAFAPDPVLNNLGRYESWDFINHGDIDGRIAVNRQLAGAPGRQLVFVHYGLKHAFHEWIHNDADIDGSRVIWASDDGPEVNQILLQHYPDRTAWLIEPDRTPPRLTPYAVPRPSPPPPPEPAPSKGAPPPLRFDDGPVSSPGGVHEVQKGRH